MAINGKPGRGRLGRVKHRIQSLNPRTKRWVESDTKTGKFINVKSDGKPFKNVRHQRKGS